MVTIVRAYLAVSEPVLYDDIGGSYGRHRRPDPAIARMIDSALGSARTVLSVGAGTGSYEPPDRWVTAVEPSSVMIRQRPPEAAPVIRAVAESLPLPAASFDAGIAVLTVHHWPDPWVGLAEMKRVARRQIVLTFDPALHCSFWLTDYVPEIGDIFRSAPSVEAVANAMAATEVRVVPLAHDTPDGMTIAYWRRPEAYLDPELRAGGSALQQVDPAALARGLDRLRADLASGVWRDRYRELLAAETVDYGLRLIVS
jgi:SAM-dependent methyltransferase